MQVCRRWREVTLRLRWRRLRQFRRESSVGAADMSDISLLLSSRVPVRLAGLGILLPTGSATAPSSNLISIQSQPISDLMSLTAKLRFLEMELTIKARWARKFL